MHLTIVASVMGWVVVLPVNLLAVKEHHATTPTGLIAAWRIHVLIAALISAMTFLPIPSAREDAITIHAAKAVKVVSATRHAHSMIPA